MIVMESPQVKSINELIQQLRIGEINNTIEIVIGKKGDVKKIIIQRKDDGREIVEDKVEDMNKLVVKHEKKDLSHADLSGLRISGDLSGIDLHETNFAYSTIENTNLSYSNMANANLYKAHVSQTDMSHSSGMSPNRTYMTGSVNLYSAGSADNIYGAITKMEGVINPLDADPDKGMGGY